MIWVPHPSSTNVKTLHLLLDSSPVLKRWLPVNLILCKNKRWFPNDYILFGFHGDHPSLRTKSAYCARVANFAAIGLFRAGCRRRIYHHSCASYCNSIEIWAAQTAPERQNRSKNNILRTTFSPSLYFIWNKKPGQGLLGWVPTGPPVALQDF